VRLIAALFLLSGFTYADPVQGDWQNIDDETGVPKAVITIFIDSQGKANGKIRELLNQGPGADLNPVCTKCPGEDHGKRAQGLVIMRNLVKDGNTWSGGTILDPNSGRVYRCRIKLSEDGKQLDIRGYIGIPLIGRSQVWHKLNAPKK